ncbi:hypothetical protein [Kitasatospora sp. NPDC056531]|uniref:hypothetical protein n=1 Tax=Kitasatospora sp. NPDC056531 TaxID=3345856 RepID=UPI00368E8002
MNAATAAIQAAADQAHPPTECPACHGWKDCPDADRAYRNALHTAWVNRWTTSA